MVASTDSSTHQPDDTPPSPERQAELTTAYERNLARGHAPYWRVALHTRGELRWIMVEREWAGDEEGLARLTHTTPDLRGVNLQGVVLGDVSLIWANLSEALLERADLRGANLRGVNFTAAHLDDAVLMGALLRRAILSATDLHRTDLRAADLHGARLDALTILRDVRFDLKTRFADVVWNNAPLAEVDWSKVPMLGEEEAIAAADSRQERAAATWHAIRAYRGLAMALRAQGLSVEAKGYRLRAIRLQRHALFLTGKLPSGIGLWLVDVATGFGTKSGRILALYLVVILGYGVAYHQVGQTVDPNFTLVDALIFSVSSFHGRGFFPSNAVFQDPRVLLAASEAVIGLLIEALLVATLARLFLGELE